MMQDISGKTMNNRYLIVESSGRGEKKLSKTSSMQIIQIRS